MLMWDCGEYTDYLCNVVNTCGMGLGRGEAVSLVMLCIFMFVWRVCIISRLPSNCTCWFKMLLMMTWQEEYFSVPLGMFDITILFLFDWCSKSSSFLFKMVTQGVSILLLDVSFTVSTLLANSSPCFKFLISPNKLYCFGLELVKLNAQDIMATLTVWIKLVDFHCQTLDQSGLSFKIAISWH